MMSEHEASFLLSVFRIFRNVRDAGRGMPQDRRRHTHPGRTIRLSSHGGRSFDTGHLERPGGDERRSNDRRHLGATVPERTSDAMWGAVRVDAPPQGTCECEGCGRSVAHESAVAEGWLYCKDVTGATRLFCKKCASLWTRRRRHTLRWLIAGAAVMATAVLLAAGYAFLPAFGRVSPETLSWSVMWEVGGITPPERCTSRQATLWTCTVSYFNLSSSQLEDATYLVTLDGRCWSARRVGGTVSLPDSASRCVRLHEQLRLFSRISE